MKASDGLPHPWFPCPAAQDSRSVQSLAFSDIRPRKNVRNASTPSFGGDKAESGSNSGDSTGKSAGRRARKTASSWNLSDQNGFTAAGPSTTGGPLGRITPSL